MAGFERLVLDTNMIVSGLLFPGSPPSRAFLKAQRSMVLASEATRLELITVMNRARFDRYMQPEIRQHLVALYLRAVQMVEIPTPIRACRDPKDDKFLEVAVHGRADAIITGDTDLLELTPFHRISILTPMAYLGL